MNKRQNTRVRTSVLTHVNRNDQPIHTGSIVYLVDGEAQFAEVLVVRHYLPAAA